MTLQQQTPIDLRLRVVAVALEPALRLAHLMALPLHDLQELVTIGYFREARRRGLSLRAIAARFGKSLRTIASLSRRSAREGVLLNSSLAISWRRRIIVYLGSHGAASFEQLRQAIPEADETDLRAQLDSLLSQDIVTEKQGVFRVAVKSVRADLRDLAERLDSLRQVFSAVTQAAYWRFYTPRAVPAVAFARVLSFRTSPKALAELSSRIYDALKREVIVLDDAANADPHAVSATVTVVAAEQGDAAWRS